MNPDLPHNLREELEARLSALLLGELSADDAALLHKLIAHDPELAKLHDQLKLTIDLVRETASDPVAQASPQAVPLKLSEAKREKLLAQFKTVTPKEFAAPRRSKFSLVRVAAAVAVVAAIAWVVLRPKLAGRTELGRTLAFRTWSADRSAAPSASDQAAAPQISMAPLPAAKGGGNEKAQSGEEIHRAQISGQVAAPPPLASLANSPRTTIVLPNAGEPAENRMPALTTADSYDGVNSIGRADTVKDYDAHRYRNLSDLNYSPRPPVYITPKASGNTRAEGEKIRATENSLADEFGNGVQQNVASQGEHVAGGVAQDRGSFGSFGRGGEFARLTTNYVVTAETPSRSVGFEGRGETGENRRVRVEDLVGDPDWVGLLERPDRPYTATNQFVARYAYTVTPPGQVLDSEPLTRDFAGEDRTFRTPNVGEGFYYQHAGGTSNWMGNFTIADGRGEGDGAGKGQANKTADLSRSGLETRTFHVDPNTFYQGLESVGALDFSTFVPKGRTMVAGGGGMGGGGGGGFGGGGAGGRGGGGGLAFVTQTNGSREVQDSVRKFYSAVGVELDPKSGKDVVYNGRTGELTVRGTAQDLETIAAANETLAIAPPEINVKAKFVDEPSAGLPALTPAEGAIARTGVQSGKQSLLGDEPVLGHLFRTQGQAVAGAKPTEPPVTAQNGGESWSASSSLRGFFDDGLNRGAKADSVNLDVARFTNAGTLALNGGVGFQAGLTRDDVGGLRDLYDAKPAGQKQTATTHLIENANAVDVLSALQATVGASSRNSWENPVYSVDAAGYYNLQTPPSTGTPRQTEVIPMKYAKASEIASALNEPGANSTRHSSGAAPFTERTRRSNIVLPSTPNTQVGDATVSADGAGNRVHTDENLPVAQVPRTVVAFDGPLSQTVVGTTLMDVQQQGAGAPKAAGSAADRVHNAAMYYKARKLDEAEAELKSALQKDPNNSTAYNLSRLVQQARNKQAIERQTVTSEKKFAQIEDAWNEPVKRFGLTMTNSVTTSGKTLAKEVAQLDSRTRAMQDKLSNVETQLIKLEYANPSQLADTLRTLMSTNAKVVADERIGQLTVAAKPDDLERIGAVVAELDQPTRQVLIEARSLETETQANLAHIKFATIPNAETRIFQLSYASPAQLAAVLRTLMSTNANVLADVRTSQLVVEGTRNSLRQINEIVYAVDNPGVGMSAENLKKIISAKLAQTATPVASEDQVSPRPATPPPIPQPEVQTTDNAFSTFSLNVSDVSFKLAAASLGKNSLPDPASIRSEEFINAFDYRDPEAAPGAAMAFVSERARYPFAYNRDLLRFSIKTAATGRQGGRALNLVLLLDNSGSMERADRVEIIHEALRVLASQLQPQDTISVVTFSRTARLWVDGLPGNRAGDVAEGLSELTPQGGTNLEDAMNLAYATALRHYLADGINRVVLLTDGAANLGDVDPDTLKQKVEAHRKQGIALDCFGIGWEGYNDDLLEVLSRNGDGRYGFINSPEEASTEFAAQLAGALQVAASDVKVQVEFNPKRVTSYRQIGYAKHQLTKEQFRDNTVDAAEIASQEAGNALYTVEVNPAGEGPLCTVHMRYKIPGTSDYREQEWAVPFNGNAVALEQSSPAMRLAATASAFSEWLATSPYAAEVTTDQLLNYLSGVPEIYGADARPKRLEWMIRQAKSVTGK